MHGLFRPRGEWALWLDLGQRIGDFFKLTCQSPIQVAHPPFTNKREGSALTLTLVETPLSIIQELTIWG